MQRRLRVLRPPTGAAPEHVRRAWVGLELPVIAEGAFSIQSVLDPERARSLLQVWWWHITGRVRRDRGFVVPVLDALAVLERARPLEAGWWRQNAPHLCEPGKTFVFDLACGELVD